MDSASENASRKSTPNISRRSSLKSIKDMAFDKLSIASSGNNNIDDKSNNSKGNIEEEDHYDYIEDHDKDLLAIEGRAFDDAHSKSASGKGTNDTTGTRPKDGPKGPNGPNGSDDNNGADMPSEINGGSGTSVNVDNLTTDKELLPPSMVQVKPKSPILRISSSPHHHHHHHHRHHRSHSRSTERHSSSGNINSDDNDSTYSALPSQSFAIDIPPSKLEIPGENSVLPSSSSVITAGAESVISYSSTSTNRRDELEPVLSRKSSASTTHSQRRFSSDRINEYPRASAVASGIDDDISTNLDEVTATTTIMTTDSTEDLPPLFLGQRRPSASSLSKSSVGPVNITITDDTGAHPEDALSKAPHRRKKKQLNIENLIQRLLDAGYSGKRTKSVCLKNSEIALICSTAREIFLSQPTLIELNAPVKIVGDIHGQYSDLIRIFTKCGFPPSANYLFLGDYVDRGKQSLETILLLFCYKIKYPENFFLLRGNHECAQITRAYGFYDECKRRTNLRTWKIFIDTFNTLPVCALVASKIFCVHGGLSPVLNSIDEIRNIKRPTDVPDFGLLNDLLWSDPADQTNEWEDNERGVSYCFNRVAINKFLNKFQFDLVARAHMVVEDGYEFFNDRSLVTVFSAPNYCGEFDNWGAVMSVSEELLCSFELLDPLDSVALKRLMKKGRIERRNASIARISPQNTQSY
ncbi:hypothetical protein FOA43_003978 [Brettanomyces nanus]|uniref:Serine/threonine-protein phosphatase n=1 Tax=Eeniella nana TaxID=13502 RepID=A0A875RWY6_EENNA|nr:uncharacterized protein FOA43_003978 [Brettanomyces nanus]QPG76587.1 hypothetical protein FOA43_003978 [Brettanomyces nanus]